MVDAAEPQTMKGLRDRALLLLGFAGRYGARSSSRSMPRISARARKASLC